MTVKIAILLAMTLSACGQVAPPMPPYNEWSTNVVLMAIETNSIVGWMRVMRPATLGEIAGTGWFSNGIPGTHPALDAEFTNSPIAHLFTNSFIAHPERKRKIIAYRKECPECGVSLTSTNIQTSSFNDETNSFRMVTVTFECRGCDETYVEKLKRPIRKTKVEEITVEVVK